MRLTLRSTPCFIAILACVAACPAAAQVISGRLELVWGDRRPDAAGPASHFRAGVVDAKGRRIALDTASALRASGDLYALYGRDVAVSVDRNAATSGQAGGVVSDAIVPLKAGLASTLAVGGAQPWVSILCKFADNASEPNPLSYFTDMFANQPDRLDHYWREVSYGKINILGSHAYGWFTLPHPRSYYVTTDGSGNETADLDKLFDDCTAAADPTVDFSSYVGINQMFKEPLIGPSADVMMTRRPAAAWAWRRADWLSGQAADESLRAFWPSPTQFISMG